MQSSRLISRVIIRTKKALVGYATAFVFPSTPIRFPRPKPPHTRVYLDDIADGAASQS